MSPFRRSVRVRVATRLRRSVSRLSLLALAVAVALVTALPGAPVAAAPPADRAEDGVLKVLLFYKTNFHASNVQARQAVRELAGEIAVEYDQELEIIETDQAAAFTSENLADVDTLAFMQTGGQLFNDEQRAALEDYIRGGGGWMGQHYAAWSFNTQSEHDVNPFYARLVGATSDGHPENPAIRSGEYVVEDLDHPLTQGLSKRTTHTDEWYDWNINPAQDVRTLVTADEATYATDATGGRQGTFHPITWCQQIDQGRSWYTGLGHEGSDYAEPGVRTQMKNALAYTSGLLPADCSPPAKDEQGAWSGVTPWPLMPINASLTSDGTVQSFGSIATGCTDATPYDWTGNTCIEQGGDMEVDIWDPAEERTLDNLRDGIIENTTYTDLFCSMQVQDPTTGAIVTVGGDDGLGGNAPNDAAPGVTSYTTNNGLQTEAPMTYSRWYPTGTTMPNGDIVVQGGSEYGGPGGPGILTPEIRTPDAGSGWKTLDGARSAAAYGDGGNGTGPDENRWWYPRAFVVPGKETVFNISGTQMFELDPYGNAGEGEMTLRGRLPEAVAAQGNGLGNPVGATSTATMYRPGKILQVGGGWWANGGGPDGARAGFTVDLTGAGGTANPEIARTSPMKFQRHWASSTVMPDGNVMVTGGGRENNGRDDTVTNPEIWNPDTGEWTEVKTPHEHARLYHSTALLLPDGRIMIGGGGAPGPRNYTDVEFYSPDYLYDGQDLAERPQLEAPDTMEYSDSFDVTTDTAVERVTLVRNGSVTHGFNNDQNFQDLDFTQSGSTVSIDSPVDGTYAPPGSYMLFVWDENGTPSVASIMDIAPVDPQDVRTPQVVEQFEYPRFVDRSTAVVPEGSGRMAPWTVERDVELVRAIDPSQRGLSRVGFHLGLGADGSIERDLAGLDVGREYRISMRYARDSRSAGAAPATARLSVGDLEDTLSSIRPSNGNGQTETFETYVATFTADSRREVLSLSADAAAAGMMIDDLVVIGADPGVDDVPVRYEFEEGDGTSAANTGTDGSVGAATLTGETGWTEDGVFGGAVDLPGGSNANAVDLPDNLLQGEENFSTSFWVRPDTKANWIGMFHLGDGLGNAGSFFQIQMQTQAAGNTGLAATFKAEGSDLQERVYASPPRDVTAGEWNHVAFTREGATGTLYLDGQPVASRDDLTIDLADVGPTSNNWIGRNGFPDPALDGAVDELRLYETALTDSDIAGLYADGAALRTTTTVSVDPASPSPFDEPLTVTATVDSSGDATPEGEALLFVDGESEGGVSPVEDGIATFPGITLSPGEHDIEVRFSAAEGFRDSVGSTTHVVERPPPGEGVPIRYSFDEGTGRSAANSGTDSSVGPATLTGSTGWSQDGRFDAAVSLPGGAAASGNQVELPDDITDGIDTEASVSMWVRPDVLPNWVSHLQIGKSTQEFFLLQSSTENGARGFAATLRVDNGEQYRIQLPGETDVPLGEWTHVVVTLGPSPSGGGTTGKIYFNGELMPGGVRDNIPVDLGDIGDGGTTANFIGGTSWPDPRADGLVDEFQMFGYELTAEQVAELTEGPVEEPDPNVAPVAVADDYTTDEGQTLRKPAPGVLANDTDGDGDPLTATGLVQPENGVVTLAPDGSFTYAPDAGFSGVDTFTYRANDGTVDSGPATVTITVEEAGEEEEPPPAGNAAPVAVDDLYVVTEDEVLEVAVPGVLANDTDEDGDPLTATIVRSTPNGELELAANGSVRYTPSAGFTGIDTFTYRASDGTLASGPATVRITVEEAEDVDPNGTPVGMADIFTTDQGTSLSVPAPGILANDSDPEGDELRTTGATQPENGSVVVGENGAFVYVPDSGFSGVDTFTYRVTDSQTTSEPVTVAIAVNETPPSATVLLGSAGPGTYGRGTRVVIAVAPRAATGEIEVARSGRVLATATISSGRAVAVLPGRSLRPGRHELTLTYAGDESHAPYTTTIEVRIRKAAPRMRVQVPDRVRLGQRATARVRLSATGGVAVVGQVKVRVNGNRVVQSRVRDGVATVRLPRATRTGRLNLFVRYLGSGLVAPTAERVSTRVVRRR